MWYADSFKQDFYLALRIFRKRPGYTFFAVTLLALILGVNGAVFSIINSVLLRPLPFQDAGKLVAIWESNPAKGRAQEPVSLPDFSDWQTQTKTMSQIAAMRPSIVQVSAENQKTEAHAGIVSDGIFRVLAVQPLAGRTFQNGDDVPQGSRLTIISESFWKHQFGRDNNIVGRGMVVDNALYTVIGVVPDIEVPNLGHPDLWLPMHVGFSREAANLNNRSYRFLAVIGRMNDKSNLSQVQAELSALAANIAKEFPTTNPGEGATAVALRDQVTGHVRDPLLILWAAVGLLLLLGCANIANLIIARALARQHDIAVRLALGCSRARLISQLIIENGLVAFAGGVLGISFAYGLIEVLAKVGPTSLPRFSEVSLDAVTCLFIAGLAFLITIIFGVAPAIATRDAHASEALKESKQGGMGARSNRLIGAGLMGSETVLSLILLICAGLAGRSFLALSSIHLGFSPDNVVTANLIPYSSGDTAHLSATYDEIVTRLATTPGVVSVGASQALPLGTSNWMTSFQVVGQAPELSQTVTSYGRVAGDYFGTMRIGLIAGRYLTAKDRLDSPHVAVVNEAFVARFLHSQNPLGKQLAIWDADPPYEIVGVVANATQRRLEAAAEPLVYLPYSQHPQGSIALVVGTTGNAVNMAGVIRHEINAVDSSMRIQSLTTMDNLLSSYLAVPRYSSLILTAFAIFAAFISGLGIYAVTSHRTIQRRPEIGVRIALGAAPASIIRLVLVECITITACAIAVGLGFSILISKFMRGIIYGISMIDSVTFIVAPLLILIISTAAAYSPARRASHADPLQSLRSE